MSPRTVERQRLSFDTETLELGVSIDEKVKGFRRGGVAELPGGTY